MTFTVRLTLEARRLLLDVSDRRERALLVKRIDALAHEPEKQGKPLLGELAGLRSVRAAGQRYRIVYRVEREVVEVLVIALGRRRAGTRADVYELARKLIRLGIAE